MLDRDTIERASAAASGGPFIIALSGGGDSTALLHLCAEQFGATRLRAVVIDHALRAGSAGDARKAAGFAKALGVPASVVKLDWPTRGGKNQETARELRYAALSNQARKHGARVIFVAHNADDQAETVLMRAAAGSSWRGLAGMAPFAPAPVWPEGRGVLIARPVLNARREAPRAYLREKGADWLEDPANANAIYERVRVRARLAVMEESGFDAARLTRLAAAMRARAEAVDAEAARLISAAARFEDAAIQVDLAHWSGTTEARVRALALLIAAAAGAAREPAADAVARLDAQLAQSFSGATLGGARLRPVKLGLSICRDPGALMGRRGGRPAPSLALTPGIETIWDGRLAFCAGEVGLTVWPCRDGAPLVEGARSPLEPRLTRFWLLEQHVQHRLGPLAATKAGLMAAEIASA